jgi:hypothetical protein
MKLLVHKTRSYDLSDGRTCVFRIQQARLEDLARGALN